jgi:hypothetical protein
MGVGPRRPKRGSLVGLVVFAVISNTDVNYRRPMATRLVLVVHEMEGCRNMNLVLRSSLALGDEEGLDYANESNGSARPPSESGQIDLNTNAVKITGDRCSHSATRSSSRGSQTVDLAEAVWRRRCFLDEDKKHWVGYD